MKQEIIEGNKLIAEFMGAKSYNGSLTNYWFDTPPTQFATHQWNDYAMQYHEQWNWIMPVVEKINVTKVNGERYDVIIYRTTCHINDERQILVETTSNGSLIETVWKAVVEFIQWYNQQSSR